MLEGSRTASSYSRVTGILNVFEGLLFMAFACIEYSVKKSMFQLANTKSDRGSAC